MYFAKNTQLLLPWDSSIVSICRYIQGHVLIDIYSSGYLVDLHYRNVEKELRLFLARFLEKPKPVGFEWTIGELPASAWHSGHPDADSRISMSTDILLGCSDKRMVILCGCSGERVWKWLLVVRIFRPFGENLRPADASYMNCGRERIVAQQLFLTENGIGKPISEWLARKFRKRNIS